MLQIITFSHSGHSGMEIELELETLLFVLYPLSVLSLSLYARNKPGDQ